MSAARSVWQVLVVDAAPHIPRLIALLLGEGHDVDHAASAAAALERLQARPYDVVLVDLGLDPDPAAQPPAGDGEPTLPAPGPSAVSLDAPGLLERIRDTWPDLGIVALAAAPTVQSAVAAMRLGAFDVLRKTCGADELRAAIARAGRHGDLAREVRRLRSEVDRARGLGELVGTSAPMRQLLALVERVAASDATVLILGESGTGKELLARTLHRLGPRADQPFVAFDCSALTPSLLEAELFGHERGAFTGAARARRGLFREAHRGTIFLDEIGDIAPSVQNKLLRVLQEREIKPVGADHFVPIDVRVVAATNKDLGGLVARGEFREDLYWRLAVVPVQVPPLRERKDDLPMLAVHLLARRRGAAKTAIGGAVPYPTSITPDALTRLMGYHWPGNIRELENVLSRAAILCDGQKIRATDLDLAGLSPRPGAPRGEAVALAGLGDGRTLKHVVDEAVRAVEQAAIAAALERCDGSPARAATLLGISRASIYTKMKAYGLER